MCRRLSDASEPVSYTHLDVYKRQVPGVLGNEESAGDESFSGMLLEYPQYTRPREFHGTVVPEVLLSGHHEKIRKWRLEKSMEITMERRPDLLNPDQMTKEEKKIYERLLGEKSGFYKKSIAPENRL